MLRGGKILVHQRKCGKKENDNSWHWAKRLGELRNDRWHESFAIETQDGNIQGAILYWLNTRSFVESEKGAVYLEALATAPRNRPLACLLSTISRCRRKSAFEGSSPQLYRINLLSFRDERTVSFYKNRGFEIVGEEKGLDQMELAPSRAFEWLKDEGYDI
jgi:hypothetical protein